MSEHDDNEKADRFAMVIVILAVAAVILWAVWGLEIQR
jgi:hypothetical protein